MAAVRETYLRQLAGMTGLSYTHMGEVQDLSAPLIAAAHARPLKVATDVRAVPGVLALALLTGLYGLGALTLVKARRWPSPVSA
jgi:mxaL protein